MAEPAPTTDWRKFAEESLRLGSGHEVRVREVWDGRDTVAVSAQVRSVLEPDPPPAGCKESAFQRSVNKAGDWGGWDHYHTLRSKGSNPGFPDWVAIRAGAQGVVAELKVGRNKPTKAQLRWLELFRSMGFRVFVWYPKDWPQILEVLR